uniref:Uncharacterized protein n=1 Tax=uncultured bacterium HF770_09N20 TaxID=710816 RepID=E0XPU1_9BACT|nr:hypothetical protein [uncultured bacterium HF770_09N20]
MIDRHSLKILSPSLELGVLGWHSVNTCSLHKWMWLPFYPVTVKFAFKKFVYCRVQVEWEPGRL